jgi:hypothetical protein
MHYKILSWITVESLEADVNSWLIAGYEPLGGVCRSGNLFLQAMIKKPQPKE